MKAITKFLIVVGPLVIAGITAGMIYQLFIGARVRIYSNGDFSRFPGDGSSDNPFIIEDLNLNTWSSYGLEIKDVSVCFEIRNCDIRADWGALILENIASPYCRIVNSSFHATQLGIKVEEVKNIIIENCQISSTQLGLHISHTDEILIFNNNILGQFTDGINVGDVISGSIFQNTIEGSSGGLNIVFCSLNVSHNQFIRCGIEVGRLKWEYNNYEAKLNISNNQFSEYGGGIYFDDYMDFDDLQESIFENNTINDKPLICLTHKSNRIFLELEIVQFTLIKCINISFENTSYTGAMVLVQCTNISFENANYTGFNQDFMIKIWNCSLIRFNNSFFSNFWKIYIDSCQNITITFCYFEKAYDMILEFEKTLNSIIHHNSFMDDSSVRDDLGSNNLWYDENLSQGNYWIHYTGYPAAYAIPGSTGSVDLFPLSSPPV
ncbi:MAG: hypothetical protein GPJ51_08280 [Candidatus Heimdallarchaeota archaeon]|nr:hypothetical protein [Candidatus Heimdallarchaeota archaeon]